MRGITQYCILYVVWPPHSSSYLHIIKLAGIPVWAGEELMRAAYSWSVIGS